MSEYPERMKLAEAGHVPFLTEPVSETALVLVGQAAEMGGTDLKLVRLIQQILCLSYHQTFPKFIYQSFRPIPVSRSARSISRL